jgi:hypothetical protein
MCLLCIFLFVCVLAETCLIVLNIWTFDLNFNFFYRFSWLLISARILFYFFHLQNDHWPPYLKEGKTQFLLTYSRSSVYPAILKNSGACWENHCQGTTSLLGLCFHGLGMVSPLSNHINAVG